MTRKKVYSNMACAMQDDLFVKEKAKLCKSKDAAYRKQRKWVKKEARFEHALKQAMEDVPKGAQMGFSDLYLDAYARICCARKAVRAEVKGEVKVRQTNAFYGPSLSRLAAFLAEEHPTQNDLCSYRQQIKPKVLMRTEDFKEMIDFEPIFEGGTMTLTDVRTVNFVKLLKPLSKALPQEDADLVIASLATEPWVRATRATNKLLWTLLIRRLADYFNSKLGTRLTFVWLGELEYKEYIKFQLSGSDKWHTAGTEAEAKLVAKATGETITTIVRTDNLTAKPHLKLSSDKEYFEAYARVDGEWAKADAYADATVFRKLLLKRYLDEENQKISVHDTTKAV